MARQAPLSMEFSRQEYRSGLRFPSPGDLPNPGIEPRSPALQADTLPSEPPGKLKRRGEKSRIMSWYLEDSGEGHWVLHGQALKEMSIWVWERLSLSLKETPCRTQHISLASCGSYVSWRGGSHVAPGGATAQSQGSVPRRRSQGVRT